MDGLHMTKAWADRIHSQPMFDILSMAHEMDLSGNDVKHLEIGDTEGFENFALREHLVARAKSERLGYCPSGGEPRLREVVAEMLTNDLGRSVEADQIAIAPANFLILQAMAAISKPQSGILLPDPGFPTYRLAAEFLNLDVSTYNTIQKHLGSEDLETTAFAEGYQPAMVVMSNPNNPLGHGAPWSRYEKLLKDAQQGESWLLFDETYVKLCYDQSMGDPPAVDEERCIRIYSVSKEHAVPGLRMGYCLGPREVIDVINRFTSLTVSCVPSFIQLAVADYLESDRSKSFVREVHEEMKKRFRMLEERLEANGLDSSLVIRPNAGFYAMIRTPGSRESAEEMLKMDGVATCPGSGFGSNSAESIRVSLAGSLEAVLEGIDRLAGALAGRPHLTSRD
ncbi:MAG: hypothetical protein CL719_10280 [Chloroflexi bacterium]|nr:hypothetical protein [Chloroflexota bacterium]